MIATGICFEKVSVSGDELCYHTSSIFVSGEQLATLRQVFYLQDRNIIGFLILEWSVRFLPSLPRVRVC